MIVLSQNLTFWSAPAVDAGEMQPVVEGIFTEVATNQFGQKVIHIRQDDQATTVVLPTSKIIAEGLALDEKTFEPQPVAQLGGKTTIGCKVKVTYLGKKVLKKAAKKDPSTLRSNDYYNQFSVVILELPVPMAVASQETGAKPNVEYVAPKETTSYSTSDDDLFF